MAALLPPLDGDLALLLFALTPLGAAIVLAAIEARRLTEAGADATLGWCVLDHLAALWRRRP